MIAENRQTEQRKIVKYNHLVANLIILHNVHGMTQVLNQLSAEDYTIDPDLLKQLAPYRTQHINRFGSYTLNLDKYIEPLVEGKDFELKLMPIKSRV